MPETEHSSRQTNPAPPPCPKCGSVNTKQIEVYEDSYGALITEYDCLDCKHEFQKQVGG